MKKETERINKFSIQIRNAINEKESFAMATVDIWTDGWFLFVKATADERQIQIVE